MTPDTPPWDDLLEVARQAQARAYAPYSRYLVGASLLTASGRIFGGCNIENASYGLALCAERTAVAHMIAAGEHQISALVVLTRGPEPAAPCGMCRQTLVEFAGDVPILLATSEAPLRRELTSLAVLQPLAFRGTALAP